ncbi:MAG: hypothetical protein Q6373_003865 [Candidatus Sigynarchaeota archaeon]
MLAFLGLIFDKKVFNISLFANAFLIFILLCIISSSNYIMNDLIDKKKDALNQIKAQSLFARINPLVSISIAIILVATSIALAAWLVPGVVFFLVILSGCGQFYNVFAKKVPILDIIVLLFMYLARIYAGYISLEVIPYSLIILPITMLALFLIFIKKRSTLLILGEAKAIEFRKNYRFYTMKRNDTMIILSGIGIAIVYLIYVAINDKFQKIILYLTIPAVFILIITVIKITRIKPEYGLFLFKILKKKEVLVMSIYIVAVYLVDIIFL